MRFLALLLVFCLLPLTGHAAFPPKDKKDREFLATVLSADQEFVNLFIQRLVKNQIQKPEKSPDGMTSGGSQGMTQDSGMLGATLDLDKWKLPGMENFFQDMEKAVQEQTKANMPGPDAKIEVFSSLSCVYCWQLWTAMRDNPNTRKLMEETDKVTFRLLVDREETAFPAIVFQGLVARNEKSMAYSFMDFLAKNQGEILDLKGFPAKVDAWMKSNGLEGVIKFAAALDMEAMRKSLESHVKEFADKGYTGTPTVVVDGKPNAEYLNEIAQGNIPVQ